MRTNVAPSEESSGSRGTLDILTLASWGISTPSSPCVGCTGKPAGVGLMCQESHGEAIWSIWSISQFEYNTKEEKVQRKTSSWCLGSVECETKQLNVYHGAGLCSQVFCIAAAPLKAGWGCEQTSSRDGSKSIIKPRYSIPGEAHGSFSDPAAHNEAPNTGNIWPCSEWKPGEGAVQI